MKKNCLKLCLSACILLGMMSLTVAASAGAPASAEENGYWTTKVDVSGETVQIFVYTEPVEWEICEAPELGRCNMDGSETPTPSSERIAGVGQAEAHLAETESDGFAGTENVLISIAVVGALALAGLGYALYRAV